jgi:molecular chaperone GrpE
MKKKIVIPTEQDVARYGGDPASPQPGAGQPESRPADEPGQSVGEQAAPETGQPAAEAAPSVEVLKAEAEQWKDKCLRARAELANYQRRVEKDRAESLRYANAGLVKALVPVLDDLERVLGAATEHKNDPDALIGGLKLALESFLKVLKDFGVRQIEAAGKPFDPNHHEAILQQPSPDYPEPTVLSEVAKGYVLHDRVLRPVRVIVSKPVEPGPAPGQNKGEEPGE